MINFQVFLLYSSLVLFLTYSFTFLLISYFLNSSYTVNCTYLLYHVLASNSILFLHLLYLHIFLQYLRFLLSTISLFTLSPVTSSNLVIISSTEYPLPIPRLYTPKPFLFSRLIKCRYMPFCKIHYMDIISYSCTVYCVIIIPKYFYFF